MAGMTPLPPSVLHTSTRLTHTQAHERLSKFLEDAENDAAYRPDSILTERGPQSVSTSANPNLTLHHLRRILQGIEGKRIGGEDVGRFFGEGAKVTGGNKRRKLDGENDGYGGGNRMQIPDQNAEDQYHGPGMAVDEEHDGWQDKGDFELAQKDDEVDMVGDERHPGAYLEEPADNEEAEDMVGVELRDSGRKVRLSEQEAGSSTADKASRKAAKRARLKVLRREKEDAKAQK